MRKRNVSTSFLVHDSKYLLVRRSADVSVMRNLWSAISGTINDSETPLERAYSEILEETGIASHLLCYKKSIDAVEIELKEYDCIFCVYGFLFSTISSVISLNWENSEYRWINRCDIDLFCTVPKLGSILDALV